MHIDLNADLGEGGSHDRDLLALVTSANISCGVHAGDPDTIAAAIRLAIAHRVRIGAHPSFPDRENFGRSEMQLPFATLRNHMLYQLGAIDALVKAQGTELSHIKPHGALYNQAATDRVLADNLAMIFQEFNPTLTIVGLAGGELVHAARQANLRVKSEVFADRTYTLFGTLVPRSDPGAVIHDPQRAIAQSLTMIRDGYVMSVDGHRVDVQADTLCVHGDTPEALLFAKQLRAAFTEAGITFQ
ncbi:MAG: 5-oxoprolinase subunit PxpA [Gammaproteobacteria bacterium]|nr:5-oxoprolinase subunit PxpA [Gammaproteobacteria bacterium]MDP2140296.1 5-oxoprolinase subunit PxpA [Gammaproteobacteria bacterium]MDP2346186.1 5-oxoprolinase subunit PxpA [Gammaproteobacteria bacterium]